MPKWNFQCFDFFVQIFRNLKFRNLKFPGNFCGSGGEGEGRGRVFCVLASCHVCTCDVLLVHHNGKRGFGGFVLGYVLSNAPDSQASFRPRPEIDLSRPKMLYRRGGLVRRGKGCFGLDVQVFV